MTGQEEIKNFVAEINENTAAMDRDPAWPRLTIVTPSWNQAEFLERTILSVLNQGYPNLEYIIIDGGSTDGSVEIIRKYEKYLSYWVSEPDGGQVDAINKGFERATGDIVAWQNSDDLYLPGALAAAVEVFRCNPAGELVFGDILLLDEDDQILGEQRFTPFSVNTHLYDTISVANQCAFWKRSLFDQIGMLDPRFKFSLDYEFFLRAGVKGARFHHVPAFWGAFRFHDQAKTNLIPQIAKNEHQIIYDIYGRNGNLTRLKKCYSVLRRSFYYLCYGDVRFLVRGLRNRSKGLLWGKR